MSNSFKILIELSYLRPLPLFMSLIFYSLMVLEHFASWFYFTHGAILLFSIFFPLLVVYSCRFLLKRKLRASFPSNLNVVVRRRKLVVNGAKFVYGTDWRAQVIEMDIKEGDLALLRQVGPLLPPRTRLEL